MPKTYIFGIGGTGSRVLKSLTFLLAAGIECKDTIVPIIIDPDQSNKDLTRTVELMKRYNAIRQSLQFGSDTTNRFFAAEIQSTTNNFSLPLEGTNDKTFCQYIDFAAMTTDNQALIKMLFSDKNLNTSMDKGFLGNPNIGSVVLNQFTESVDFINFANNFAAGDRIFIISSIFGGTGASGFPLLAKTLRFNNTIPNHNLINNATIGAITVLPYFKVKQDDTSNIDSTTFHSKARAALHYYENNISNNKTVDALYYIGDNVCDTYSNSEGGNTQENNAHFVELSSALAILDFVKNIQRDQNNPSIVHKEFAIENGIASIGFNDLCKDTKEQLQLPLSQFVYMCKYMDGGINMRATWARDNMIDEAFVRGGFYKDLSDFKEAFRMWLKELKDNKISFDPFIYDHTELGNIVKGHALKKGLFKRSLCKEDIDDILNIKLGAKLNQWTVEQQFMECFYNATKQLLQAELK